MNRLLITIGAFLLLLYSLAAWGQSQQTPAGASSDAAPSTTIRSTSQEVVLDMTFRDKKGKTLRDIRPEEVHITEDGAEVKLRSFRLVEGTAAAQAPTGSTVALDPMREVRLVSLVFEGLDPDGKRFFRQALKDILDMTPEQNLYFSVYTIDQRLNVIQPFTSDHAALLKSVDKSAMWSFIQNANNSAEVKQQLKLVVDQGEPGANGAALGSGGGAPAQSSIQGMVNYRMAKMQYDMLQQAEAADREFSARASLDALMALVRAEAQLPGRKVVLYFNPSLNIPEMIKEQYANLISMANRANISFYTVDPKGLVTKSQGDQGRDDLNGATSETRALQMSGGHMAVTPSQAAAQETAEQALRDNPLLWLRDLATETGGATIAETNDYRAPFRTAMEEVRTYYEAAYSPRIDVYDGKFRKISVHVDRPNVVVHTRSGYFALPQTQNGQTLLAYEMPLLNALGAQPAPHDLDFEAGAERFNDHGPKVQYMITVEAPLKGLTFAPQPDQKNASLDVALLAVVRNASGEIVEKFSKDFAVQVPLDTVEARKAGNNNLLQTFSTSLAPGTYTLEAAAMDRNSNKLGTVKNKLVVPEPSNKLSISDVVLVRRTDQAKDEPAADAFYYPGGKVVPTLTDTVKGGPGNVLPFYFTVYPDPSAKDPVKSFTMSFYRDGKYLGSSQAPLQAAEPDGRIPYIANLPGDVFTPGAYQIKISVAQGNSTAEQNVGFHVN